MRRDSEGWSAVGPEKRPAQIEHDLAGHHAWFLAAVSTFVLGVALGTPDVESSRHRIEERTR